MSTRRPWIRTKARAPEPAVRLFCFPYAGASGATVFRRWCAEAPSFVDVCPIDLPGRWGRLSEPPFRRMEPLLDALDEGLAQSRRWERCFE